MQFTIGFGLGFDKSGKPIDAIQRAESLKIIMAQACVRFGGCNITFGQGAWINGKGDLVVEESATLVVQSLPTGRLYEDEADSAKALARLVRTVLEQEAVILTSSVATSTLVEV